MSAAQDDEASAAGRQLAAARWGDRVLRGAVEVVISRAGQLDERLCEQLQTAIDDRKGEPV
jgi:hypothetical protein